MILKFRNILVLFLLLIGMGIPVWALSDTHADTARETSNASWTFVGLATNEANEPYYYYFQIQQQNKVQYALVFLLDTQNKKRIDYRLEEPIGETYSPGTWKVGRAFMQFNAINNSWIFGLKNHNNQSFNFRVELLKPSEATDNEKDLAKGLHMKIMNARRMNGHIRWGEDNKEEFVTAEINWYRSIIQKPEYSEKSALQGVFCFLDNGTRFYSVKLPRANARSASEIFLRNPDGKTVTVSQFLEQKTLENRQIQLALKIPALRLTVQDILENQSEFPALQAGIAYQAKKPAGFCFLDEVGSSDDMVTKPLH